MEFSGLDDLIGLQILTVFILFLCICHDGVLAEVDVPVIFKINYHAGNYILPLTIGVIVLHGFHVEVWVFIFKFKARVSFYRSWKHIWVLCRNYAKFLTGILTGWATIILSSITACEVTNMMLLLYWANLLLSSVHPSMKQWQLRNSSPKIKGLFNPSHTINLWVKLQDPILKFTMIDPSTPILCPFAVLTFTLLSEILCNNPSAEAVSYLIQLPSAPVSNRKQTLNCLLLF